MLSKDFIQKQERQREKWRKNTARHVAKFKEAAEAEQALERCPVELNKALILEVRSLKAICAENSQATEKKKADAMRRLAKIRQALIRHLA